MTISYYEKIRITGVCLWTMDPDPFFTGPDPDAQKRFIVQNQGWGKVDSDLYLNSSRRSLI